MDWARRAIFYHIVIDRFATGRCQFRSMGDGPYEQRLTQWLGGGIGGIAGSLDYLRDLGVDALLLTPFFRGAKYHGYWPTDFFEVDPHFGDVRELGRLIAAAHRRDMRVVMDLPFTHCHIDADIARQAGDATSPYRHWFRREPTGRLCGYYGDSELPDLNLDFPEVVVFVQRVIDHWLAFGFDGVRFDHAKRPSRAFWERIANFLRVRHPRVFLLGENWHESGRVGTLSGYLHGELNIPLSLALRRLLERPQVREIEAVIGEAERQRARRVAGYILPTFLDNHDMERVSQVVHGDRRMVLLGFLLQMSLPDPPIVYYGSERAQAQSANLPAPRYERDRYFREPMDWSTGEEVSMQVGEIMRMRRDNIACISVEPTFSVSRNGSILSLGHGSGDARLTVAINFDTQSRRIDLPVGGRLLLNVGEPVAAVADGRQIELPARSGVVVKSVRHGNGSAGDDVLGRQAGCSGR